MVDRYSSLPIPLGLMDGDNSIAEINTLCCQTSALVRTHPRSIQEPEKYRNGKLVQFLG